MNVRLPSALSRSYSPGLSLLLGGVVTCSACGGDSNKSDTSAATDGSASSALESWPPEGGQGTSVELTFRASSSTFSFDGTSVDLGEGISVDLVNVDDGWTARANITIADAAALGSRDITIQSGSRTLTIPAGFAVVEDSFDIHPDGARLGETLQIDLVGRNTEWQAGTTWPSFGDGVDVLDFTVLTDSLAQATVSVQTDTVPGWRNVVMDNGGGSRTTAWDGFKVDRVALAASFDPPIAEQGDTVEFTVRARGTDFLAGSPRLTFSDQFGDNPDIVVDSITVLDAENLYGRMTLSSAASLGDRDVQINIAGEGVRIPDAFEVVGGGFDIRDVAVDLSFYVVRERVNETGELREAVVARCIFFIPLDPPCPRPQEGMNDAGTEVIASECSDEIDNDGDGFVDCKDKDCLDLMLCMSSGPMPEGNEPSPYDDNGVQEFPPSSGGTVGNGTMDCPPPTTLSAGDFVWLESDANIVTLVKTVDAASGMIVYEGQNLTMADYVPDNLYDLHTQGDPAGIPEYLIEDVQPTVPADWQWTYPDLWGNYTHDRTSDFDFRWTPAGTYPDAIFVFSIFTKRSPGPMSREGYSGWGGAYPWDDGEHTMLASEMSRFAPGPVPLYTYSYIEGREFGLPDSIYQENTAPSYIYLVQQMILE